MKITIKIYQQPEANFEIDAEASETVANLKAKINDSQGHDIGKQNLIFCGRVLADDRTLESYRISEKGFLVLMISRPIPPLPVPKPIEVSEYFSDPARFEISLTTPSATSSWAASALYPDTASAPVPPTTTSISTFKYVPMSPSALVPAITPAPVPATTSSKSTFKYVPMSTSAPVPTSTSTFKYVPMSTSARATASTSTRVPAPVPPAGQPQNLSQQRQQQGGTLGAGVPGAGSGDLGGIAALRDDPQIAQFRELVSQNPELRQIFIQRLAEDNPELAQSLTQNPDLLLQLLGRIGEDENAGPGAPVGRLNVTEAERGAIERLEALGFPKQAVIEAYFACDKNEELAANYLLENV